MKKATITPKAGADLKDISRYTDKKWGRQQRFKYIKQLQDRFSYLIPSRRWAGNATKSSAPLIAITKAGTSSSIAPFPKVLRS